MPAAWNPSGTLPWNPSAPVADAWSSWRGLPEQEPTQLPDALCCTEPPCCVMTPAVGSSEGGRGSPAASPDGSCWKSAAPTELAVPSWGPGLVAVLCQEP
eukprot:1159606-Pelagomonas_calceolata.AAC.3